MKRILKIISVLALFCVPAGAQTLEKDLREEVSFFADSLCAGRGFGTTGDQVAAFYILRQLRNTGLSTFVQSFRAGGKIGHNVIGVTPGWFKRYVVVGAYFDGFGKFDDEYYPGADSNASGIAALLSLSRELTSQCKRDTGLIFVAFDGHNSSLSGAEAFVSKYSDTFNIHMMVNLDILGSTLVPVIKTRPDYIIALGASPYRFALDYANREYRLDLNYNYYGSSKFTDLFYRSVSDQKFFLSKGIPCVMFTSGITLNTNKLTDTPETLDYPVFAKRVGLIMRWLSNML